MLNSFQHPSCRKRGAGEFERRLRQVPFDMGRAEQEEEWTLKQVQGDQGGMGVK